MATWNVGGLTAANALEMLRTFGGNKVLSSVSVVLLQEVITNHYEVITEVGRHFASDDAWTLVHGKMEGEWRGEGVAFRNNLGKHSRTRVMRAGVATVLCITSGKKWGLLSAHVPHHATMAHTETLMAQWGGCPAMATKRAIVGIDANEQFRPTHNAQQQEQAQGGTGRGECILSWMLRHGVRLPPQDLAAPTHFPYDTTQEPRRLDYVGVRGVFSLRGEVGEVRDMARSDHEPVLLQLRQRKKPCGPRHAFISDQRQLHALLDEHATQPSGDRHEQIKHISQLITRPGRGEQTEISSSRAGSSSRRAGKHTPQPRDKYAGKHGRRYTSSSNASTSSGNTTWRPGPANMTGRLTANTNEAKGGRPGWQHSRTATTGSHKSEGAGRDADFQARRQRIRRFCKNHPQTAPDMGREDQGNAQRSPLHGGPTCSGGKGAHRAPAQGSISTDVGGNQTHHAQQHHPQSDRAAAAEKVRVHPQATQHPTMSGKSPVWPGTGGAPSG